MKIAPPKVETVKLDDLKPWIKNPRKGHAVDAIAKSVESFGYLAPIIVQTGTLRILAGHGRYAALKKLGVTEVPVIVADVDQDRADLYTVADNQLGTFSEFDFAPLADLMLDFDHRNLDTRLTGFDDAELKRIMEWTPPTEGEETKPVPEPPTEAVTKPGDLWELGKHRLLCGDSTKAEDVARLMNGEKAGLVYTDPPYGVGYDGGSVIREKLIGDETTDLYGPCCRMAAFISDERAALYLWHAGVKGIAAAAAAAAAGYEIRCEIVWNKNQAQFGAFSAQYKQKHEPAYYCFKRGHAPRWHGPTNEVTVWDCERAAVNEFHPTQKPVALAERAIQNSSQGGDIVWDGFLGSGSTLIASEKLGRRCYAMEIEPRYVDVAVGRWQNFSGKKANNLTRPEIVLEGGAR